MSNLAGPLQAKDCEDRPCDAIEMTIRPREKDLGGFLVRRLLPFAKCRRVGPWVFFDHAGPAEFAPGTGIDVRPHPHIGLATVTYLFEGAFLHRDSLGSIQTIVPGDINLMVAGKGIVHSERTPPELRAGSHRLHALQLWLALPRKHEETDPAFYHYPARDLPRLQVDGVTVRVMIGSAYGVTSPVKTFSETLYVEAHLNAGQSLVLPNVEERAIYVARGRLAVLGAAIPEANMAVFRPGEGIVVTAERETQMALIGGKSIGDRFMEWNFVSSRKERLELAKQDWKAGRFKKVPGDDVEFIPLP